MDGRGEELDLERAVSSGTALPMSMTNEEIEKQAASAANVAYNKARFASIKGVLSNASFEEGHRAGMIAYHLTYNETFNGLVRRNEVELEIAS